MTLFRIEPRAQMLAPAPLLERLVDLNIEDLPHGRTKNSLLNATELKESVLRELSNLLDTRIGIRWSDYEVFLQQTPLLLPYGIPDLADFPVLSETSAWKIQNILTTIIGHFEPRLQNIRVRVEAFDHTYSSLSLHLEGTVTLVSQQLPLTWSGLLSLKR